MHNTKGFEKFIRPEIKGSKKKEAIRQEKRKIKKEITEKRKQRFDDRWQHTEESGQRTENKWRDEPKGNSHQSSANAHRSFGDNPRFGKPNARYKRQDTRGKNEGTRYKRQDSRIDTQETGHSQKPAYKYQDRNQKSSSRFSNQPQEKAADFHRPTVEANMPLNKFIAYCGICGRREAAELVKQGLFTVNGDIIFEPGFKVRGNEDVKYKGKRIFLQHNLVYILLNKPKDYLTTAKDPEGRKTVYDLIKNASQERVYSVGRLDRNTTGVLLLTNDGELAQKLTHPSFQIKKVYEVTLDKPLTKHDFEQLLSGVTLEDGFIKADAVGFVDAKDKRVIGVEIHSGRNRIVRRIFEHLGYDVKNLDRVMFANLTKKNVDRGKWRMLNEKEVRLLKHMNQSFVRKA